MKPAVLTIQVLRATPTKWGYCRGCHARIEWVETVKGRHMPVDWPLQVLAVTEREDGRLVVRIDAAQSHFVTCSHAEAFRRDR